MQTKSEISITGTKPLLINTFPIDTLSTSKAKSGTTGNDSDSWKKTALFDANRQLYIFPSYIVASITAGGKQIKVGKSSLSKKIGATLECMDAQILINRFLPEDSEICVMKPTEPVYIDVRSVVNPATKGRNLRYRVAASPGWELTTIIAWDNRAASKEDMKQCVENAGLFEGIGDGRKIGFGRFVLKSFKMVD